MKGRIVRFNSVPLCRLSLGSAATVSRAVCESSCGHQGGTRIVSQSAVLMQRGVPSHSLTFDEAMARWKMCHRWKCHVINWRWRAPHDITQLDAQCITDRPSSQFVVASRTDLLVVTTSQTYTIRYDRHACDIDHCQSILGKEAKWWEYCLLLIGFQSEGCVVLGLPEKYFEFLSGNNVIDRPTYNLCNAVSL